MSYRDLIHKVYLTLPNTDTEHIDHWCIEHFGGQGKKWDCYFADDNPWNYDQYYVFAVYEDAVLFTLRWGT